MILNCCEIALDLIQGSCYSTSQFRAEIAQSVEQGTENPRVRSSILRLGTSHIKEPFEKCSILFEFKPPAQRGLRPGGEGEYFNHRNTLSISRIKI